MSSLTPEQGQLLELIAQACAAHKTLAKSDSRAARGQRMLSGLLSQLHELSGPGDEALPAVDLSSLQTLVNTLDSNARAARAAHEAALKAFLLAWTGSESSQLTVDVAPNWGRIAICVSNIAAASPGMVREGTLGTLNLRSSCELGAWSLSLRLDGERVVAWYDEPECDEPF